MSWQDREPRWSDAAAMLKLVVARSRARWYLTVLLACLSTAAVVAWRAMHPRTFEASVVVRVVEQDLDPDTRPPSSRELTSFIQEIFLSRSTLQGVIDAHQLYPEHQGDDPELALEAMRDDLGVRLVENYFAPERYIHNPVRTARIVISYEGRTPDEALEVVRDLGMRIADEQIRLRQQSSELADASARLAKQALVRQILAAREQQAELNSASPQTPLGLVRLAGLQEEITSLELSLRDLSARGARLSVRQSAEAQELGVRFELVDTGTRPRVLLSSTEYLALTGGVVLTFLVPISMLVVGGLTSRVDPAGLRHLGIGVLGELPWPPPGAPPPRRST